MDPTLDAACRSIVTEYLLHNCHKNTAMAFMKETAKLDAYNDIPGSATQSNGKNVQNHSLTSDPTPMDIDDSVTLSTSTQNHPWDLLDARKELYDSIIRGDIKTAFDVIHRHFSVLAAHDTHAPTPQRAPPLVDYDPTKIEYILFKLRCQQFIEIVRSSNETEALQFAQTYLKSPNKHLQEMVHEVASLIAYKDPHNSTAGHLLSQERRQQLADEVNTTVLGLSNMRPETSLERLSRHLQLLENELDLLEGGPKTDNDKNGGEKMHV